LANNTPTILVAPLNWGLGHTTRCVPIISELLSQNVRVLLAGDGRSLTLLHREFPNLPVLQLPPYDIVYPDAAGSMALIMAAQVPKILYQIRREHLVLQQLAKQYAVDAVISDNRYGCYLPGKPSVFMTHQIFIQTPPLLQRLSPVLLHLNQFFIHRFNYCWIPDMPHPTNNLSGNLAHTKPLPSSRYRFIGPLSRMKVDLPQIPAAPFYKASVVLSGLEPQRSYFEKLVLQQAEGLDFPIALVRGITETGNNKETGNVHLFDHLTTTELNRLLLNSEVVVARSGYSTIMDLAALGKKAALVPTPGQTEQEYLADKFMRQGIFYSVAQPQFQLKDAIHQAAEYNGILLNDPQLMPQAVKDFIGQVAEKKLTRV
jgi:uncharacterized protein (TIGR00661 family)